MQRFQVHFLMNKKEITCHLLEFAISADHIINMNESEELDKYLDFLRELKKLWNMKITGITFVVGALKTVSKDLEKKLDELENRGKLRTIQTTTLLKST